MKRVELGIGIVGCAIAAALVACTDTHPTPAPGDRNTNWLTPCTASNECGGGLDCIADVCTRACDSIEDCKDPELALRCTAGVCSRSSGTPMPMAGSSAPAPDASMPKPTQDASMPTPDAGGPMGGACDSEGTSRKPGPNRYDRDAPGPGACSETTLGGVIAAIHAAHPDLADITYVIDPKSPPPPIVISAQVTAFERENGFAIVMQRGAGDCESGCITNEYWYFRTDADCVPQQIGHYRAQGYEPACMLEGYPMWDTPVPPADYPVACGGPLSDWPPQRRQVMQGCGERMACALPGSAKEADEVTLEVEVESERSDTDPSMTTVTLRGTGHELLDGRPFAATLEGGVVRATISETLPSTCLEQFSLELQLDFDGNLEGYLRYEEVRTPDCASGGDYCKGSLNLTFERATGECAFVQSDIMNAIDWARAPLLECETDGECTALFAATSCIGGCQVAVRADGTAELEQAMEQIDAAFCPDTTCRSAASCVEQRGVCHEGKCDLESVSP